MPRPDWSRHFRRAVNGRLHLTRAGMGYLAVWLGLLFTGLQQQNNLILLTAGMAAGPLVASFAMTIFLLRRLKVQRRLPEQVFEGDPLAIDYIAENTRHLHAALAFEVQEVLVPVDRSIPNASRLRSRVMFDRVAPHDRSRIRWEAPSPPRGRYELTSLDLLTRAPFGLVERRLTIESPDSFLIYPKVSPLSRRWAQLWRESSQSRKGRRHDRTAQQQEYHGLRDYRSGDSLRLIHWRTSARVGELMVKEYEQENDQELAILLDAWQPRNRPTTEQREVVEQAIRFTASACLETSRTPGRRLVLGWTGAVPGIRQGPSGVRLLHEVLGQLATLRANTEGPLSAVFDGLSPSVLRDALIVVVTTRPINLAEEIARSARLSEASTRGLAARLIVLDVSKGEQEPYLARRKGDVVELGRPAAKSSVAPVVGPAPQAQNL